MSRPKDVMSRVRAFLAQFAGQDGLEVALEATTGWRCVAEELQLVGADVHLAEPTEAAALKGNKRRAKTDWADARHLRELLLIGRVPESWIPPDSPVDGISPAGRWSGWGPACLSKRAAASRYRCRSASRPG